MKKKLRKKSDPNRAHFEYVKETEYGVRPNGGIINLELAYGAECVSVLFSHQEMAALRHLLDEGLHGSTLPVVLRALDRSRAGADPLPGKRWIMKLKLYKVSASFVRDGEKIYWTHEYVRAVSEQAAAFEAGRYASSWSLDRQLRAGTPSGTWDLVAISVTYVDEAPEVAFG